MINIHRKLWIFFLYIQKLSKKREYIAFTCGKLYNENKEMKK